MHIYTLIITHVVAAIAPFVLIVACRLLLRRLAGRKFHRRFWERQGIEAATNVGLLDGGDIPPPLQIIEDRFALEATCQAISLCREHGVFAFLEGNPGAPVEEIGRFLGFSERQTRAGIQLLEAAGVLLREGAGYALSRQGRIYLLDDSPMFDAALPPPQISRQFLRVLRSGVVSGAVAKWATGKALSPGQWAADMHRISFPLGFALSEKRVPNLAGAAKILDVAGGAGSVCIALALREPQLHATVLELPGSVPIAARMISKYGLSDRISLLGGDMFTIAWPSKLDAILFTNIFHDWEDEKCQALARKAYAAVRPGGIIVLQEALLGDDVAGPLWTAHFSLRMALVARGRQYTGRELKTILASAGFDAINIEPSLGYYSVIIGRRPE
jgi:SAM-dependent methyltransferase